MIWVEGSALMFFDKKKNTMTKSVFEFTQYLVLIEMTSQALKNWPNAALLLFPFKFCIDYKTEKNGWVKYFFL